MSPVSGDSGTTDTWVSHVVIRTDTGLFGELEHLKIKSRLIDEMFASVMGEHVFLKLFILL